MSTIIRQLAMIFGNVVVLDADAKGLTKDERNDLARGWLEDWRGH